MAAAVGEGAGRVSAVATPIRLGVGFCGTDCSRGRSGRWPRPARAPTVVAPRPCVVDPADAVEAEDRTGAGPALQVVGDVGVQPRPPAVVRGGPASSRTASIAPRPRQDGWIGGGEEDCAGGPLRRRRGRPGDRLGQAELEASNAATTRSPACSCAAASALPTASAACQLSDNRAYSGARDLEIDTGKGSGEHQDDRGRPGRLRPPPERRRRGGLRARTVGRTRTARRSRRSR